MNPREYEAQLILAEEARENKHGRRELGLNGAASPYLSSVSFLSQPARIKDLGKAVSWLRLSPRRALTRDH